MRTEIRLRCRHRTENKRKTFSDLAYKNKNIDEKQEVSSINMKADDRKTHITREFRRVCVYSLLKRV